MSLLRFSAALLYSACMYCTLAFSPLSMTLPASDRRVFIRDAAVLIGSTLAVAPLESFAQVKPAIAELLVPMKGKDVKMKDILGGKATLVVNVASYCALTPQYKDLVQLYDLYHDSGLQIAAFPCNQFGSQEPESDVNVIRADIGKRFGVKFPIFDKINVNGENAHPLYLSMKSYEPELSGYSQKINWNFEKFLLDANGTPVRRYRPGVLVTDPQIIGDVEKLIKKGSLPARAKATSVNNY